MNRLLLTLLVSLLLFGCKDDSENEQPIYFGYNYMPINIGQTSIYRVDSILYDDFDNSIDTVSFQRKEIVLNSFKDDAGRDAFAIERSIKNNDTSNWIIQKIISYTVTSSRYEKKEDNLTTVNLVFPISKNKKWDGNAFNIKDELEYSYTAINQPLNISGIIYDSVLTVLQEDEFNRIQQFFTEEKYATNVGLVYREDNRLNTDLDGEIRSGYKSQMTLLEFQP